MAKAREHFGHKRLAGKLAERLKHHFKEGGDDDSLVIGLFGEWGSGKSNLLKLIHAEFPQDTCPEKDRAPVVVVPFNPWRHEKETHLIVPLIRTMQLAVDRYARDNAIWLEGIKIGEKIGTAGKFLGISALAFLSAFKFSAEAGNPLAGKLGVEFSPKELVNQAKDLLDANGAPKDETLAKRLKDKTDNWYFEFEQTLNEYVSDEDGFRLLFLIDDIDRCLPEKAVEMLESIKLFLDIAGCAFVLAVDDEVVERGILHRYRDYLFHEGETTEDRRLASLPITGTEYLEKIIQLPFRLPLPSRREMREFLQVRFGPLFHTGQPSRAEAGEKAWDETLLDAFVAHVPPVPRKHIRVAELMRLLLDLADARGVTLERLVLFKLTLLQLFAPELYRLCRRYSGNLGNLQGWLSDEQLKQFWGQNCLGEEIRARRYAKDVSAEDRRSFDRVEQPLLHALERCAHNRSGFDPFALIQNHLLDASQLAALPAYFSFVGLAGGEAAVELPTFTIKGGGRTHFSDGAKKQALSADQAGWAPDTAAPVNPGEFLDLLFSSSPGNWQSAVQVEELHGKVLDAATFERIKEHLAKNRVRLEEPGWVTTLATVLDAGQFKALAALAGNFEYWQTGKLDGRSNREKQEKAATETAFYLALKPEQREALGRIEVLRDNALQLVRSSKLDVPRRAEAGRLLGELGDSREGVGLNKAGEPDIDWVAIRGGQFTMGSPKGEGHDDERPEQRIEVADFRIGRYPVTNAQYACFIAEGGYENGDYWKTEAARDWLDGKAADWSWYKGNDDYRKEAENWLKEDGARRSPRFWNDSRWINPNHPVVGVSWYETRAFCA